MPELLNNLNFEAELEPWNVYEIAKYGMLRIKLIVSRIMPMEESYGDIDLNFKSTRIIDFIPYKEVLGEPDTKKYSQQELFENITVDDLDFKTTNEDWNVYILENGKKLRIKPTLVKASLTSKFDLKGEPILVINSQPLVKIT